MVAWDTKGNSGTTPDDPNNPSFLGTIDNQPLAIRTDNIERLRVDQNGNVAIGAVSTDVALLQVGGPIYSNTVESNNFALNSAGVNFGFISNQLPGVWSLGYGAAPIGTLATPVLSWTSGGNVGIGTDAPQTKLEINSGFATDTEVLRFGYSTVDYHSISTSFHGSNPTSNYLGFNVEHSSGDVRRVLTLQGDGHVGIGTANPKDVLEVQATYDTYMAISGRSPGIGVNGIGSIGVSGICGGDTPIGEDAFDCGVWGQANFNLGTGVKGRSDSGTGVSGGSTSGTGVSGYSTSGTGVSGGSASGTGVYGQSNTIGVFGQCFYRGNGVVARYENGPQNDAYLGTERLAGAFNGDVYVAGTFTKSGGGFRLDHPLDPAGKYLSHSFVESSDMKNIYDGIAVLDDGGQVEVELPSWFDALNTDFRYQLTCIGGYAPVYIAQEIRDRRFKIAGGTPGMKVSWQVTGIRQDPWANANRLSVEEDKPADEQGYYLDPALYGESDERHIRHIRYPEPSLPHRGSR
jgi:hypothetical protein